MDFLGLDNLARIIKRTSIRFCIKGLRLTSTVLLGGGLDWKAMGCTFKSHCFLVEYLPPATKLGQGNILRSLCQEFCPQGGLQAHTQRGSWGVWQGGSPGPHLGGLQTQAWGAVCIPACTEADPTPTRQLLLRAVRILLECILVFIAFRNITNIIHTLSVGIWIQLLLEKVKSVRDLSHASNKAHIQRHPPRTDVTRIPKPGHLESHESNLSSPKLFIPWSAGHLASIYRKKWKTRR